MWKQARARRKAMNHDLQCNGPSYRGGHDCCSVFWDENWQAYRWWYNTSNCARYRLAKTRSTRKIRACSRAELSRAFAYRDIDEMYDCECPTWSPSWDEQKNFDYAYEVD